MTKFTSCLGTLWTYYIIKWCILLASINAEKSITLQSLCYETCWCTNDNHTADCSNRGLIHLPKLSGQIIRLNLSGNLLGPVINGSFGSLQQLQEIDLSANSLTRLLLCTFAGLLHLRHVDLHGNRLSSLPFGLFADNDKLESLDLSHNQLEHLPDLLLHNTPALQVLNVSHNQITNLKLGLRFQRLTHVTTLDFSYNSFHNVSSDAFEMSKDWDPLVHRSLDVSNCQIENIESNAFHSIPGLRNLSLAGNNQLSFQQLVNLLKQLESSPLRSINLSGMSISNASLFSEATLSALVSLDLSNNSIASIPAGTFRNTHSLEHLNISHNLLHQIDEGFEDMINLLELDASHCRLVSFKGTGVSRMQQLKILDLSHNFLSDPAEVNLSALQELRILDLSFNKLQSTVLPSRTQHLLDLSFASNNLANLSSMPNMHSLRFFDVRNNSIQNIGPFLFTEAKTVISANFSHNQLTDIDHRAFLPHSPKVLDLSNNRLTATQFYSLTATTELYLHNNNLKDLDQQTFYGMDHLQVLDLSTNNLSAIHDQTFGFVHSLRVLRISNNKLQIHDFLPLFHSLQSLEELDLSHSKISLIKPTSFQGLNSLTSLSLRLNNIRIMPAELFSSLENLKELDISGNPFDCGCDLLPLQEWLLKTKVQVKQRFDLNITNACKTPHKHTNKLVTQFSVDQFECNTKLLHLIVFGSIGGFGIMSGLIASLVCHYYQRQQRHYTGKGVHKIKKKDHETRIKQENRVDIMRTSTHKDTPRTYDFVNGWVVSNHRQKTGKHTDLGQNKENPHSWKNSSQSPQSISHTNEENNKIKKLKGCREKSAYYIPTNSYCVSSLAPLRINMLSQPPSNTNMFQSPPQGQWSTKQTQSRDSQKRPELYRTLYQTHLHQPPCPVRIHGGHQQEKSQYFTLPTVPFRQKPLYGPFYPYRMMYNRQANPHVYLSRHLPNSHYNAEQHDNGITEDACHLEGKQFKSTQYSNRGDDKFFSGESRDFEKKHRRNEQVTNQKQYEQQTNSYDKTLKLPNDHNSAGKRSMRHSRTENKNAPTEPYLMKRGTSETRISAHRRDAEYQTAMLHPVLPRTLSTPILLSNRTSDWI